MARILVHGNKYIEIYLPDNFVNAYYLADARRIVHIYKLAGKFLDKVREKHGPNLRCVDCGRPANLIVMDQKQNLNWLWCGI